MGGVPGPNLLTDKRKGEQAVTPIPLFCVPPQAPHGACGKTSMGLAATEHGQT
jgi:hypothetical protein